MDTGDVQVADHILKDPLVAVAPDHVVAGGDPTRPVVHHPDVGA